MAYMLITVCEREISTEKFNTMEEAREAMEKELNEVTNTSEDGDEFELGEFSAWANTDGGDYNYDWEIVAI